MGILSGLFWTILAVGLVALCARHRTTIERWLFPNQRKKSQGARFVLFCFLVVLGAVI
ncbi:hypothetical protein BC829DRAFT_382024 [Chytridium lagenaria]|nr:hypothetical protein BC829DRAFT_382024 [Chytridium lagenaria]